MEQLVDGYMDDLVLVPLGVALELRMIPQDVLAECQQKSREAMEQGQPVNKLAAVVIVAIWLVTAVLVVRFLAGFIVG